MTRSPQRAAPPRAPTPPPAAATALQEAAAAELMRPLPTAAGQAFEQMLLAKYKERDLLVRRVPMPDAVKQVAYVWIREQDSNDELDAATWAESLMLPIHRKSARAMQMMEQREAMRLSICAIWRRGAAAPEETNLDVPLVEINKWSTKFWGAVELHFKDLNGIPAEDLLKSLAGAVILGAPLPANPNEASSAPEGGAVSDAR